MINRKSLRLHNLIQFVLLLFLICYANFSRAGNHSDLSNAAKKGDLIELSRILAIAYEFSIEDTHLATLPKPVEEAIRRSNDFKDRACRLIGKPINLIEDRDNSGYAVTTADACNWESGHVALGPVGPIWVVRDGEQPTLVLASRGRMFSLSRVYSQNDLPNITITSGVAGRFTEISWKFNGKVYIHINECGEDNVSAYCRSQQQTTELNSAEDGLNQAYKLLRESISSPPFSAPESTLNALITSERNWIKQRELDCSVEYALLYDPKEKRQKFECLSRLAKQRMNYLNEIRDCIVRGGKNENCPSYGP